MPQPARVANLQSRSRDLVLIPSPSSPVGSPHRDARFAAAAPLRRKVSQNEPRPSGVS